MEKALDQLGVYNSTAILLAGLISEAAMCVEIYVLRIIKIITPIAYELSTAWEHTGFWIVALFMGYLLGMMLNSIGGTMHFIMKWFISKVIWLLEKVPIIRKKHNTQRIEKLRDYSLTNFRDGIFWHIVCGKWNLYRGCSITENEVDDILHTMQQELNGTAHKTVADLYNKCKSLLSESSRKYVLQQQTIAAMCRSIGAFFIILTLFCAWLLVYVNTAAQTVPTRLYVILAYNIVVAIIMWLRNERFVRLRYVTILRAAIKTRIGNGDNQ